ncbi:hypothetical protein ACFOWM_03325 [Ferruginibacter yonginensis]|uniref:Uncharacterized protein n=1 Tax=Ferruginibacter yonginensis TaxID=1310416 RepID=A0ABV8QP41_9BACT
MSQPLPNHPLFSSFVSPYLTKELWEAGIKPPTAFIWVPTSPTEMVLYSYLLDHDGYYRQAYANVNFVTKIGELPYSAFQLNDMNKLLPNYSFEKVGNTYTLLLENMHQVNPVTGNRLPDVFAEMVIQLINTKKLDTATASKLITS